ncbi:unnamed protein product [Didymodactylos carnosus]|uniref:NAD(P)(+)--arginine ADP-ribosyltransferase n=1 Tax=Didymodactylos carnosus TaxID=1234261 RepID=A0A815CIY5_9BILA|nr:unnamed protein product [Didymodactylos carnosus]CAF1285778.1 unnamed protein product [Didymodactylos carnosus]CAF3872276.1 unnamed protein product [Didymodactylos carnosus]CAF4085940.1 unnamed protein product [Didymodactylos carnosus]
MKRVTHGRDERGVRLREERFMPNPLSLSRPFTEGGDWEVNFIRAVEDYFSIVPADDHHILVEKAAEGLISEGKKVGKQREAEWMAQELLNVKDKKKEEVYPVCVRLYTMESFLYKKMNETMRSVGDEKHIDFLQSKVPTFGPFAYLLYKLLVYDKKWWTVYRGAQLSDDMIEQYKDSIGKYRAFPAFTSTSRSRAKAEQFGNVLFEIQARNVGADVSSYSVYPNEEEVLLPPYFNFCVRSCSLLFDRNKRQNKWIICLD